MDYIDKVFYINLDKRTDRKEFILREFETLGIPEEKIERFSAIYHEMGCYGCGQSHLSVLKLARDRKYKNILIFEDDFQLLVDKDTFWKHISHVFEKNIPYDVVMPSYNSSEEYPFDEFLSYTRNCQTASCYMVSGNFVEKLIENLEEGLPHLLSTEMHWVYTNDQYWKRLQTGNWFICTTRLGKQRSGFSDLAREYVDYNV